MIVNLQALRALAAYGVVVYHIGDSAPEELPWFSRVSHIGAAGVDIFFVLSGFIMVFTTSRASMTGGEFLLRRIARIVPAYWLVTLFTFGLLAFGFEPVGNHSVDIGYLLRSLLFIPAERGASGVIPLLAVGWTLNFEMLFYLLFAAAIHTAGVVRRVQVVSVALLALVAIGGCIGPAGVVAGFVTSPLLLEFLFGIAIACLWDRILQVSATTLGWTGGVSLALGAAMLGLDGWLVPFRELTGSWRFFWFGVPAAAVVGGALMFEAAKLEVTNRPWLHQGDASYALYLVHPLVLQLTRKVLDQYAGPGGFGLVSNLVISLGACAACGTLFHVFVEQPLVSLFVSRRRSDGPGATGRRPERRTSEAVRQVLDELGPASR